MMRLTYGLGLGAVAMEALFLHLAGLRDLRQHAVPFLVDFGIAFLLYLLMVRLILRHTRNAQPVSPATWQAPPLKAGRNVTQSPEEFFSEAAAVKPWGGVSRWLVAGVLLGGLVFRLTLVGLTPTLSGDVSRYLWDGRVQQAGINPYRYAPQDEALAKLRTSDWQPIAHKDIPTVYPPAMQLAFWAGASASPTIQMQKAIFLACDIAVALLLAVALPRWGLSPLMSLIYAWHPLVIVEVAGSGHNDPFGVLWLLIGLILWQHRRTVVGTAAFALAFLSKLVTALLIPFYLRRAPKLLGLALAVVALGYLPFLDAASNLIPGSPHYAKPWEFNSSLVGVLVFVLHNPLAVRLLCVGALSIAGWVLAGRMDEPVGYLLRMVQLAALLAPVLEPWYLVWLILLLAFRPSWGWLVFTGLAMLSYMVLVRDVTEGVWAIPGWVKWVEYVPLYAWLAWRIMRRIVQTTDHRQQTTVTVC